MAGWFGRAKEVVWSFNGLAFGCLPLDIHDRATEVVFHVFLYALSNTRRHARGLLVDGSS